MESLYKQFLIDVYNGKSFRIDLKNKTLKVNKKTVIQDGIIEDEKKFINESDLIDFGIDTLSHEPYSLIEELFKEFKYSVPSKSNDGCTSYFKALKADELTDEELVINMPRNFAQAILEGYILFASLQGWLKWNNDNHWFWQGKDKDLIILKEWI